MAIHRFHFDKDQTIYVDDWQYDQALGRYRTLTPSEILSQARNGKRLRDGFLPALGAFMLCGVIFGLVTKHGQALLHWGGVGIVGLFLLVALVAGLRRGGLIGMIGAVVRVAIWLALLATVAVAVIIAAMNPAHMQETLAAPGPGWIKDIIWMYAKSPVYTMLHWAFTSMPVVSLIVGLLAGIVLFFRSMFWIVFPVRHY